MWDTFCDSSDWKREWSCPTTLEWEGGGGRLQASLDKEASKRVNAHLNYGLSSE